MSDVERGTIRPVLVALVMGLVASGCGEIVGVAPPPPSASFRADSIDISYPAGLGTVNGILGDEIEAGNLNILLDITEFDTTAPVLEIGQTLVGPPPTGVYEFNTSTLLDAVHDRGNLSLISESDGVFVLTFNFDTDGDGITDVSFPLNLATVPGEPLATLVFSADYSRVDESTLIAGGLSLDDACAVEVQLSGAGGPTTNLLDILDGNTGDTEDPVLTPPCAAGAGPDNNQPDLDVDGDGVNDSYRVETGLSALPAEIL